MKIRANCIAQGTYIDHPDRSVDEVQIHVAEFQLSKGLAKNSFHRVSSHAVGGELKN